MTDDRLPLAELMAKAGDGDFLRAVAEAVLRLMMEADVDGLIGAGRHERSADRATWRNGYRDRTLDTWLGTLMRNALADVPKGQNTVVAAAIRQVFLQPGGPNPGSTSNPRLGQAEARPGHPLNLSSVPVEE